MTNYPSNEASSSPSTSLLSFFSSAHPSASSSISSTSATPTPYRIVIPSSEEFPTRRLESDEEDHLLLQKPSPSPFGTPNRRYNTMRNDKIKTRPRLPSLPYQNIPLQQQSTYYSKEYVFPTPPPGPARVLTTPSPLTTNRQVVDFEEWSIYETYLNDPEYQKKMKKVPSGHTYAFAGFRIRIPPVTTIIPYLLFIGALLITAYVIYHHSDSTSVSRDGPFRFPGQSSTPESPASSSNTLGAGAGAGAGLANIATQTQSQSHSPSHSPSQSQSESPSPP